jgi:hypothetical protein
MPMMMITTPTIQHNTRKAVKRDVAFNNKQQITDRYKVDMN